MTVICNFESMFENLHVEAVCISGYTPHVLQPIVSLGLWRIFMPAFRTFFNIW
jgi:hypothetical protein